MATAKPAPQVAGRRCPNCGGAVAFQPGKDALVCRYCSHAELIEIPANATIETYDLDAALAQVPHGAAAEVASGGREVQCKTCGARTVVTDQATRCPFCDAPVVVELPDSPQQILPHSVLPFGIDEATAGETFARWMRTRWFAPSDLARRATKQKMDGVYLPYWAYDATTRTPYKGERGTDRTETKTTTDANGNTQTESVTVTDWWPVSGEVDLAFANVLACGSTSLPEKLVEKLEPWHLEALVPFDDRYLAGFVAERYAVDLHDGFEHAKARMEPKIRHAIERDIGGDHQRIHSMTVHYEDTRWKHALLPLWISAFAYRDRVYRVVVNARTGEIQGERPWSALKILALVLAIAALVIAIALLAQHR